MYSTESLLRDAHHIMNDFQKYHDRAHSRCPLHTTPVPKPSLALCLTDVCSVLNEMKLLEAGLGELLQRRVSVFFSTKMDVMARDLEKEAHKLRGLLWIFYSLFLVIDSFKEVTLYC
jgi:hypothetical protein